jgi:hypothetical protein
MSDDKDITLDEDLDEEVDDDLDLDDDLDEDLDEDLAGETLIDDDAVDEADIDDLDADEAEEPVETLTARVSDDEEDDEVDLEDETHPDDVEEALDVVLRERTKQATLVEDGEEDDDEDEEAPARRSAIKGETFVCASCYFVKPIHQLVDPDNKICIDCA